MVLSSEAQGSELRETIGESSGIKPGLTLQPTSLLSVEGDRQQSGSQPLTPNHELRTQKDSEHRTQHYGHTQTDSPNRLSSSSTALG